MFDAPAEFRWKIRLGEGGSLGFKGGVLGGEAGSRNGRDELADALAAFANFSGGVLVLGVSEEPRAVTGIPREHLDAVMQYVVELVRDAVDPPLVPHVEALELPSVDGRMRPVLNVQILRALESGRVPPACRTLGARDGRRRPRPAVRATWSVGREVRPVGHRGRLPLDDLSPRLVDRFVRPAGGDRTAALVKWHMIAEAQAGGASPHRRRAAVRDALAAAVAAAGVHPVGGLPRRQRGCGATITALSIRRQGQRRADQRSDQVC